MSDKESRSPARPDRGLCRFEFIQADALEFMASYPFTGAELVYCDPPYVRSTRRSTRRLYRYEFSDRDHWDLLAMLQKLPCMVLISGYWSRLYGTHLKRWNSVTFPNTTRGVRIASEWVWFNFPLSDHLHDYRFLGSTFRERERIKRKKQRWVAKLRRMPGRERQALLAAIADLVPSADLAIDPGSRRHRG